jgi:osmoprotectant transport system ATP-binding protein
LAVAVEKDTGRFAGVVTARDILEQVKDSRAEVAESISIRDAEAARGAQPASAADAPETSAPDAKADTPDEVSDVGKTAEVDQTDEPADVDKAAEVDKPDEAAEVDKAAEVDEAADAPPAPADDSEPTEPPPDVESAGPDDQAKDEDDDVTAEIDKVESGEKLDEGDGPVERDQANDVTAVSGEPVDLSSARTDDDKDPVR